MSAAPDPVLFVGGVERSGTTLLRNMLDAHPLLALPDESYFIRNVYKELCRRGQAGAAFVSSAGAASGGATGVSTSLPPTLYSPCARQTS